MTLRFELLRGGTVLGVVTLEGRECDFPWLVGRLEPSAAYAAIQPLFAELDRVLEAEGFDDESAALHERVMGPGVQMRPLPDGAVSEVLGLSISGARVSWR